MLGQESPDAARIEVLIPGRGDRLGSFGLKLAIWTGQRVTDFAKAGAVAAGTGFGVWLTGLGDHIIEVLHMIARFVG